MHRMLIGLMFVVAAGCTDPDEPTQDLGDPCRPGKCMGGLACFGVCTEGDFDCDEPFVCLLQVGQECDQDADCGSNRCSGDTFDQECMAPLQDGECERSSDCADNEDCVDGVCGKRANGESCAGDEQCASGRCDDDTQSPTFSECV